jgi:DNA end-binding protein Ku
MADDEDVVESQENEASDGGGSRVMWSGTLTFGLVSIPVALLAAVRRGGLPLRMIDARERVPLARRYYCPVENVEVHPEHIQRGYDLGDGHFVVVRDDELAALEPGKSRDIDLRQFVKHEQIEPLLFEHSYYLVPGGPAKSSSKAYHLLTDTLERSGRAGIATFVMRGKEYLTAILARDGVLRAQTLRFHDEIRDPEELGLIPARAAAPAVRAMARVIADLTQKSLRTDDLHDEQTQKLAALVQAKDQHDQDVVEVSGGQEEEAPVQDLMAALQRSLQESDVAKGKTSRGRGSKRKPAAARAINLDELSAQEVKGRIDDLDKRQLLRLRRHEDTHKHRKSVLTLLDRQLKRRGAA